MAPDRIETRRTRELAAPTASIDSKMLADARDALTRMGWKASIARGAVESAASHVGRDVTIVELIREALRRCPRTSTS